MQLQDEASRYKAKAAALKQEVAALTLSMSEMAGSHVAQLMSQLAPAADTAAATTSSDAAAADDGSGGAESAEAQQSRRVSFVDSRPPTASDQLARVIQENLVLKSQLTA